MDTSAFGVEHIAKARAGELGRGVLKAVKKMPKFPPPPKPGPAYSRAASKGKV